MQLLRNPPVVLLGGCTHVRVTQIVVAAAACGIIGCLPVGTPPAGQHVLADRTLTGVFLSPSEKDDAPSYLFATGPLRSAVLVDSANYQPTLADLYAFPDANPVANGLAGIQPIAENLFIPNASPTGYDLATDSLGRLLFVEFNSAMSLAQGFEVWRFDPSSGSGAFLATAGRSNEEVFILSPGRTRGFVNNAGSGNLFELANEQSFLALNNPIFIGEDFYYILYDYQNTAISNTNIYRIKPKQQPELLLSSSGTISFVPIVNDIAPQLLLSMSTDTGYVPIALFDTELLYAMSLPSEKGPAEFVSASSDGHRLLFSAAVSTGNPAQPTDHRLFLYDWTVGTYATLDSMRIGKAIGTNIEWRPGSTELWIPTLPDGFCIWQPDVAALTTVQATLYAYTRAPDGKQSVFTRDGGHWFSTNGGDRPTISVGLSDHPTAARLPLNPHGTVTTSHWETDDGRLLVGAWTISEYRKDAYLVDADAGTSRALASAGYLVALGHTRALALLNWEVSRATGDLTLIDLASGEKTVLAEDVYAVDVDRGKSANVSLGTDALAPGTRVAYLTNNRLASPWDGLWLASLP